MTIMLRKYSGFLRKINKFFLLLKKSNKILDYLSKKIIFAKI